MKPTTTNINMVDKEIDFSFFKGTVGEFEEIGVS